MYPKCILEGGYIPLGKIQLKCQRQQDTNVS
jgi:hypothetical protein